MGGMLTGCALASPTSAVSPPETSAPTEVVPPTALPPTDAPTPTPTRLPASPTPIPTATPLPEDCYRAELVEDPTIPDGTALPPGQVFLKLWRVRNSGTCVWQWGGMRLVFDGGDPLSGPESTRAYFYPPEPQLSLDAIGSVLWGNLRETVAPGEVVDIPLMLRVPLYGSIYRSFWRLESGDGQVLARLWVVLAVAGGETPSAESWSGEWLHINTWFLSNLVDPGRLVLQQSGDQLMGYFYPVGGPSDGDLVVVQGYVFDEGRRAAGVFTLPWDEPLDFSWTLSPNRNQFSGEISSRTINYDGSWCGGRNGLIPPACAP